LALRAYYRCPSIRRRFKYRLLGRGLWSFYKTHEKRLMVQAERALTAREKGHLDKLADRRGDK